MATSDNNRNIEILAFAGSLRKGSYNKAVLRAAKELAPELLNIRIFDLEGIPLYNGDVEAQGNPERVSEFKEAIREADGLLIATPEYNHGVPGVTKNAIDWASRRPAKKVPLNEKPVGILGASPGMTGSARGQSQLRQAFEFTNPYCMPQPEILVYRAHEKFDDDGNLLSAVEKEFDVFISSDKNLSFQQSISSSSIQVILLKAVTNTYEDLLPLVKKLTQIIKTHESGQFVEID